MDEGKKCKMKLEKKARLDYESWGSCEDFDFYPKNNVKALESFNQKVK